MTGRGRGLDMTTPDIRTEREMLPAAAPDAGNWEQTEDESSTVGREPNRPAVRVLGMLSRFGSIRLGRIPSAVEPVKIGIVVLRHAVLN